MQILRERMRIFSTPGLVVRLWIQDDGQLGGHFDAISEEAVAQTYEYKPNQKKELADVLIKFEGVNAVEVLDASGNGIVVYKDWP